MTDANVPDTVEREMILRAPVERVWAALTDPAEIVKWFGDGADIDLRPGGAATFSFGDQHEPAIVYTVEENRRFAFYWVPGPSNGKPSEVTEDSRTLVDFTLEPFEGGTRLKLVESGFARLGDAGPYKANSEGWDEELGELATYLHAA
jgi:uncharacterized protein YndB with AHSA1/START domain